MGGIRASVVGLVALCALGCCAASASAAGPQDWMYEPTSFTEIHLQVPRATVEVLENGNPEDEYLPAEFSMAETDGVPGSAGPFSAPIEVGLKLKGNHGSGREFSEKAAFKIKFDKFVEGQRFDGLEKLTLNNMVQDPSMIHEVTTYRAFHDMGVPAPYAGYSYLTVNGQSYGLHLNIETQDAQSLENALGTPFGSPQHLFEGEDGADVSEELLRGGPKKKWEAIEVSEGSKKNIADLTRLVQRVAASTPTSFAERMAGYADLSEMTRDWLVEKFVGHWDSYSGLEGPDLPNNYYLYSDANGVFQMFPWGTDQTWQPNHEDLPFGEGGGILFKDCMADSGSGGCAATYHAVAEEGLTKLTALELGTVARCAAEAVQPWRELERRESAPERLPNSEIGAPPTTPAEEAAEVAATKTFIANRPAALAAFLNQPAPPSETAEPPCPPLRPVGGFREVSAPGSGAGAAPVTPAVPSPLPVAPAKVHLGRFSANAKRIVVHLTTSGPGIVTVSGSYRFGGKNPKACTGHGAVGAGGAVAVSCRLGTGLRRRLAGHSLRVDLTVGFTPAAGSATSASRALRLRRG